MLGGSAFFVLAEIGQTEFKRVVRLRSLLRGGCCVILGAIVQGFCRRLQDRDQRWVRLVAAVSGRVPVAVFQACLSFAHPLIKLDASSRWTNEVSMRRRVTVLFTR